MTATIQSFDTVAEGGGPVVSATRVRDDLWELKCRRPLVVRQVRGDLAAGDFATAIAAHAADYARADDQARRAFLTAIKDVGEDVPT